jgi:hypothetical protein
MLGPAPRRFVAVFLALVAAFASPATQLAHAEAHSEATNPHADHALGGAADHDAIGVPSEAPDHGVLHTSDCRFRTDRSVMVAPLAVADVARPLQRAVVVPACRVRTVRPPQLASPDQPRAPPIG